MIEVRDLTVAFGQKVIFEHQSFTLPDSGVVLLKGESGVGKTTLLRVLAGLQKPQTGSIAGLGNRKISFVFQEPRLIEHRTALENVSLVSDLATAQRLFAQLHITDIQNQKARSLSGGQQQRVSLARAFAFSNDVVLLDEPFTGLDPENKQRALELIRTATLSIIISHDLNDETLLHADRKIIL